MISFTYEYKLKPTKKQIKDLEMCLDICRAVYNWNHRERKDWIQSRKSPINRCSIVQEYVIPADKPFPNYNIQANNLTQAKKQYPHLAQVHSQVLQSTLKRLEQAWDDFFKVESRGFPKFKNQNRFRSFVYPQIKRSNLAVRPRAADRRKGTRTKTKDTKIRLPKIGWLRIRKSRQYPTGMTPKQLRIVRKATGYFAQIIFVSTESVPDILPGETSLGLDAGISSFVASSRGELIKTPEFVLKAARKLKSLQRRLKNKIKGSNNWLKLQKKIARLHFKVANRREDWLYKLAHHFCSITDNIFVEDINFKSWQKGLFGKQIGNSAIGKFINQILPFIAWKTGVYYEKVDKDFTSQECPNCGLSTGKKNLSQRVHNCQYCGVTLDRDVAAAKVIENRGIVAVGQPVNFKNACGDRGAGIEQLTLFDLVTGL
ncbi:transposase [Xenococcus sp. PCC 7305]|uniref:RNA-guided endonuclease InsQ/TnpB family protein n=1 Tax=Xenococcus sp. PCC 7305 TaxID=102125 RepID=UPI0002AC1772|nr:transposase [Xenococcus sp. PCC 7305]